MVNSCRFTQTCFQVPRCTSKTLKETGTTCKITEEKRANLWSNHVNYLAQYIFEEHRLLSHAFHSMQLFLVKELHLVPRQNSITIQIYALEPNRENLYHDLDTVDG